ncbi:MAG: RNA-binding S4 domain-containing protein [Saprospiraceae bacterium]|nr:RNA-binding S4 domain-containing protein [Saprospiraceae bacterium]
MASTLTKVRVDKWLWSVRIFKTRTMAANACKTGKVKIDGVNLKPAYMVQRGEILQVKKDGFNLAYKVVDLIEKRVSATLAAPCYENLTPEEELNKFKNWYLVNKQTEIRDKGTGRPTKRDRRMIDKHKGQ